MQQKLHGLSLICPSAWTKPALNLQSSIPTFGTYSPSGQCLETVASATKRSAGAGFTKYMEKQTYARQCEKMHGISFILSPKMSPVLKPDL